MTGSGHIPAAERPLVVSPDRPADRLVPKVGSFWRGLDGLAVVEAVSENDVVDYSCGGVTLSLPLREFFAEFPAEVQI